VSEVLIMNQAEENLMAWLRDAHAMEEHDVTMLNSLASRTGDYPNVKARLEQHLLETRKQAEALEGCILRRGGDTSTLKDLAGKIIAFGQGMSGMFADDEIVKGAMASYAFEHMEVAAYRVLIVAAEAVGDAQPKAVCERILKEELSMASDLEGHLPDLAREYLRRSQVRRSQAK
jgi:ferritin-like metal-binding protein YciE